MLHSYANPQGGPDTSPSVAAKPHSVRTGPNPLPDIARPAQSLELIDDRTGHPRKGPAQQCRSTEIRELDRVRIRGRLDKSFHGQLADGSEIVVKYLRTDHTTSELDQLIN
jgi:hypothetical protein